MASTYHNMKGFQNDAIKNLKIPGITIVRNVK